MLNEFSAAMLNILNEENKYCLTIFIESAQNWPSDFSFHCFVVPISILLV